MAHLAAVLLVLVFAPASAQPPIELYGGMPSMRSLAVSPDGTRVAFFQNDGEQDVALVYDLESKEYVAALNTREIKVQHLYFVSQDYVILRASETTRVRGYRGEFEFSAAFSWNLKNGDARQLLRYEDDLYPAQSGLGRIVGRWKGTDYVFMPAYMGRDATDPDFDLLRVDLDTGHARTHERGRHDTIDWLVAEDGEVIAREDFDDEEDVYSIWLYEDGDDRKIFEVEASIPPFSVLGVKADRSALILSAAHGSTNRDVIIALTPDGKFSEPLFSRSDADVDSVITSGNRVVYGVRYSGLYPSYEFFDSELSQLMSSVEGLFPYSAVRVSDWTSDFSNLVLYISGGAAAPAYHMFDAGARQVLRFSSAYADLADDDVGTAQPMYYKARDGEKLSGILTLPPGADLKGNYPTVIMPHGGPAAYDAVGFDWKAQFFASRGYAVIQPNFRGSSGFGRSFETAGYGEWGRGVMQHDITDAVNAAIKTGIADPDRICIVGASYGGYAALAGGAFTPDLYKCVVAIAPISDLPRMIYDERSDHGHDSWAVSYWTNLIGDVRAERDKLDEISPANYAEAFQAPVLLIHGNDDTVVPYRQSRIMEGALKRAGKDVELVKLRGGDHWFSTSEMRLDTLRALDGFVDRHIGGEAMTAVSP